MQLPGGWSLSDHLPVRPCRSEHRQDGRPGLGQRDDGHGERRRRALLEGGRPAQRNGGKMCGSAQAHFKPTNILLHLTRPIRSPTSRPWRPPPSCLSLIISTCRCSGHLSYCLVSVAAPTCCCPAPPAAAAHQALLRLLAAANSFCRPTKSQLNSVAGAWWEIEWASQQSQ